MSPALAPVYVDFQPLELGDRARLTVAEILHECGLDPSVAVVHRLRYVGDKTSRRVGPDEPVDRSNNAANPVLLVTHAIRQEIEPLQ